MNAGAAIANALWLASGMGAVRRFERALADPAAAQDAWLKAQLARHASSEFGRRHDFASIGDTRSFVRRVPLMEYAGVEDDIQRIARGEPDVLSCDRVTHLAPTSGSTGARKLIPFTPSLTTAFNAAVFPWLHDLVRQRPRIVGGPAYWSISPLAADERALSGPVPIGFADDADYLGGPRAWLVRRALAVPADVRHARDIDSFWKLTLLALLRRRDLRLISVWHPSFLELLVSAAEPAWPELVGAVESGDCPWTSALPASARDGWRAGPDPDRAADLRHIGPVDWPRWWPELQLVSCWGEQAAEPGWRALAGRLPQVLVQTKGLLSTECVVTIPLGSDRPLAITSHFFEFLDEAGDCRRAHELERGARYEVVVSNGGGLWRYRLGDVVECTGLLRATPTLRFLGRAGRTSDLRGEKLSEPFVAEVFRELWGEDRPSWAALRPREAEGAAGYDLLIATDTSQSTLADRADAALSRNPHYALARRLGQLTPVRVIPVGSNAASEELKAFRGRLGDAKPSVLLDSSHRSAP
jgi:hypothetical protein